MKRYVLRECPISRIQPHIHTSSLDFFIVGRLVGATDRSGSTTTPTYSSIHTKKSFIRHPLSLHS